MSAKTEPAGASRRHVLLAAAAATAGLGAAACGGGHTGSVPKFHVAIPSVVTTADLGLLYRLLYLEYETITAYEAGIPLLDEATQKTAEQFLRNELSHADDISGLIKIATKHKPPPPGVHYALGHPRTAGEVVDLLHRLERAQLSAYLSAIPRLSTGPVRAAAAAIFANDAQHVSLLRARLGQPAAPSAFVTGVQ